MNEFATIQEVDCYVRLTLKQWGFSDVKVIWKETNAKWLGIACPQLKEMTLNKRILKNFKVFDNVLKHEIAHFIDYRNNGNKFIKKNGRYSFHGKSFRDVCRMMKIPATANTRVPANF
jgi:predicted SprT family Zn-dependent metalloprotease